MPGRLLLIPACCTLLLGATGLAADEPDGRDLYLSFQCWQCHGYEGQGGAAARVADKRYTLEAFAAFVRRPNLMPAYPPDLLSDGQLRRIYEYVRAIPEAPALEDIPVLSND
jgi:mono/diheme cytochrome c family protein